MDSGGGSPDDVNWCLARGYQLHCKYISSQRAAVWAATVVEWFDDPAHPERQVGWVVHNVPVWAREWLGSAEQRLRQYGLVRLLRDVLCVSGFVETDEHGEAKGVVLNRGSTLSRLLAGGLRQVLCEHDIAVSLGSLSD